MRRVHFEKPWEDSAFQDGAMEEGRQEHAPAGCGVGERKALVAGVCGPAGEVPRSQLAALPRACFLAICRYVEHESVITRDEP